MIDSNILSLATFNKVIEDIPKSKFVQCKNGNGREDGGTGKIGVGDDNVFDLHYKMIKNKHNTTTIITGINEGIKNKNRNMSKTKNMSNIDNELNYGLNNHKNELNNHKNENKDIDTGNTDYPLTPDDHNNDIDVINNCDYSFLSQKYNKKIVHLKNKEIVYIDDVKNIDVKEEFIIIDDDIIIHGNDYALLSLLVEDIHNRSYVTLCKLFRFINKKYNIKDKAGKQKKKELEINIRNFFINYK